MFDLRYLEVAEKLAVTMIERFEDRENGAFFSMTEGDTNLVLRMKEDYDGAEPSGNSFAVLALLRLAEMRGRADFRQSAERALAAFAPRLRTAPVGVPQMLVAYLWSRAKPKQIVVAGDREAAAPLLQAARAKFLPERVFFLIDGEDTRTRLAATHPAMAGMTPMGANAAAYICENFVCQLPVTEPQQVAELLK